MIHYFAYGSNMDKDDLDEWCNEEEKEGKVYKKVEFRNKSAAKLKGFKLRFNYRSEKREAGAANIMEDENHCVYGLLMEIGENELKTIRKKEGYSEDCSKCYYNEVCVDVEKFDGTVIRNVKTYKVAKSLEKPKDVPPKKEYIKRMIKNAQENKFPKEYIRELEHYLELAKT